MARKKTAESKAAEAVYSKEQVRERTPTYRGGSTFTGW